MNALRLKSHKINPPQKQNGAALLLFILLLVVGATTLLVSKLNKAATQYYRDDVTMKALQKAKEALIGYTVSYPEMVNSGFSPGHMPCPDTNGNGSPNPPCGAKVSTTYPIGRLPWEFIGLDDIRDSSGERLWYAVSNNFKNNPKTEPMNSESSGQLLIDSNTDIVAVIIAPGSPVCHQNRPTNQNVVNQYLEDDNANNDQGFVTQGTTSSCNDEVKFNDIVLPITRAELMLAIERRISGDVETILKDYKKLYSYYPWLSPFDNPRTSQYDSVPLTTEGLLPIHINDEIFTTDFTINWDFSTAANVTIVPSGTITQNLLEKGVQSVLGGQCRWKNKSDASAISGGVNTVQCQGNIVDATGITWAFNIGYNEDINFDGISSITDPTSAETRTRTVVLNSNLPDFSVSTVLISATNGIDTGTISIQTGATGLMTLSGLRYDLNTSPGENELPEWFTENNWHHLIYTAYANDYSPGGGGSCIAGSCLSVDGFCAR